MRSSIITTCLVILMSGSSYAADRSITMSQNPTGPVVGESVQFQCDAEGDGWGRRLRTARITIINAEGLRVVQSENMVKSGLQANYEYVIPGDEQSGNWKFKCVIRGVSMTSAERVIQTANFTVAASTPIEPPVEPPPVEPPLVLEESPIPAHNTITQYNGPATCIACHETEATEMLQSLHMQRSGPTPKLSNTNGEALGKGVGGINTFCTYAMSSKAACFSCHVRADGNAPDAVKAEDVDCLMCHNDTYQRKFVSDPNNSVTVTNVDNITKSYVFG